MFEQVQADDGTWVWTAVHHPFTSPNAEWIETFDSQPGDALAWAYDLRNGNEIGGGSIRIHNADVQRRVFDVLASGRKKPERSSASCWMLSRTDRHPTEASPSAGIAFACCSPMPTLRDVIAFPKTGGGHDPLTGAPTPITTEQRSEAGIDVPWRAEASPAGDA